MLRSFLIGLVAGGRAMTPLAALSNAARKGELPPGGLLGAAAAVGAAQLILRGAERRSAGFR